MANETSFWNTTFNALEEQPYLNASPMDTIIEKELDDYDSLVGLRAVSSKMLKDSAIAQALYLSYLNSFMGGHIYYTVNGAEYSAKPTKQLLDQQFKAVDKNRLNSLDLICESLIAGAFKSGDILIHPVYNKNYINDKTGLSTVIELITADRIVTPYDLCTDPLVRNGIKYRLDGMIEGFYVKPINTIFEDYFSLNSKDFQFIPLFKKVKMSGTTYNRLNCMLFKSPLNPEANCPRGIPALTQASKLIRYMDKNIKAIVIGMYTAACFSAFITGNNPRGAKKGFDKSSVLSGVGKMSPGMIYFLRHGEKIDFASPQRPADNTRSFMEMMLILCGASVRVPYELGFLHLSNTSFSSWKGGANEIKANRGRWLNRLQQAVHFITNAFMFEASVEGLIRGSENLKYEFRFPKFDPLDDEKTARANRLNLETEVTSRRKVSEDNNEDFDILEKQLLEEQLLETERQAEVLRRQKDLSEELGIVFPDSPETETETETETVVDQSERDNKDDRKDQGNW